ncbi:hypothetical protein B484DRAFT_405109 [Ochromonadaceae sp. CCMP2298]|nr:hypothetical protein B484DRAFT_405109 [Ochromonadaceae sp. CCMP2298]
MYTKRLDTKKSKLASNAHKTQPDNCRYHGFTDIQGSLDAALKAIGPKWEDGKLVGCTYTSMVCESIKQKSTAAAFRDRRAAGVAAGDKREQDR